MNPMIAAAVVLTSDEIAALPIVPLGPMDGVTHRVLWHNDTSTAGVLTVDAGCGLGRHTHRENQHHMWVLDGHPTILDTETGPGSYVHVPSGVDHDIVAPDAEACTVFYLYLRTGG